MERIAHSEIFEAPLHAVYVRWTRFEQFAKFMEGLTSVMRLGNDRLEWRARVGGQDLRWEADITDEVEDAVIAWRTRSGARHEGKVRFTAQSPERTLVELEMEYELPRGVDTAVIDGDSTGLKDIMEFAAAEAGIIEPVIGGNP